MDRGTKTEHLIALLFVSDHAVMQCLHGAIVAATILSGRSSPQPVLPTGCGDDRPGITMLHP